MGGTRFRILPTSRGFWLRRTARRPANKMGRRPSTSAENFRRPRRDICPTSRELGWGTSLDVQRKCAPTSRENVPRRPEEMCPDVQRESTNVSRKTIVLTGRSLWTSGTFFSGRRGSFPLDVGTHFLWTSRGVAHPILWTSGQIFFGRRACVGGGPLFQEPLEGTLRKTLRILRTSSKCGGGLARSIGDFLANAIRSNGRNMLSSSL